MRIEATRDSLGDPNVLVGRHLAKVARRQFAAGLNKIGGRQSGVDAKVC
jgi:hypothetical protein